MAIRATVAEGGLEGLYLLAVLFNHVADVDDATVAGEALALSEGNFAVRGTYTSGVHSSLRFCGPGPGRWSVSAGPLLYPTS